MTNPAVLGSRISSTMKNGMMAIAIKKLAPVAAARACSMVASRAVTRAARMVAVAPLGQSARIQNVPARRSAIAARSPAQVAPTGSLATTTRADDDDRPLLDWKVSQALTKATKT